MENVDHISKFSNLPELLAPAGSYSHLKAAILAGADAVYIGGRSFSARSYADNLGSDEVKEALAYTHFHGRKLYLTVNTLMKDEELNHELYGFLKPYYEAGLDGVIVQDLGTASFIHRNFPDMEIHASTQMTITHAQGAIAAGKLGMTRIVPARELSLHELITIKKESGLEVEVFIHGALCYCYSGQCLLSSHYGGRSGNRGQCAQPCRLPYQMEGEGTECLLSMRDLCGIEAIPGLADAGIDSLKIEGRMKNVDYVAGVTSIYRKYLNLYDRLRREGRQDDYRVSQKDLDALEELYCRGGFTQGYLSQHNGPSMMAVHTQKNLGKKIGEIQTVDSKRRRIRIRLSDPLNPRDILVIPGQGDKETVLTVPQSTFNEKSVRSNKAQGATYEKSISSNKAQGARIDNGVKSSKAHGAAYEKSISLNIPQGSSLKKGMPVYRRRNEVLSARIREEILDRPIKYPVEALVNIRKDIPAELTLTSRGVSITIKGPVACQALSRAISIDDVEKQFKKTGETPFILSGLTINLDEDCFMPLSALKQLRQEGYRELERKIAGQGDRNLEKESSGNQENLTETSGGSVGIDDRSPVTGENQAGTSDGPVYIDGRSPVTGENPTSTWDGNEDALSTKNSSRNREFIAVVYDEETLNVCLASDFYSAICLPADSLMPAQLSIFHQKILDTGKKPLLSLPKIMREGKDDFLSFFSGLSWDGIYVHNINEAAWLAGLSSFSGKRIASSFFYQWNAESLRVSTREFRIDSFQLPVELGSGEWERLITGGIIAELVAYGHRTLMISAQCIKKTTGRCDHQSQLLTITDPKGRRLPVTNHCSYCYNRIWSHEPVDLTRSMSPDFMKNIPRLTFDFFRTDPVLVGKLTKRFAQIGASK